MSKENVELIRRSIAMFTSGEEERSIREFAVPEIEFISRFGEMDGRTYQGLAEIRDYIADIDETWARYERKLEELVDAGDAVVAIMQITAVSRATGLEVNEQIGLVYWLDEGKITRMVSYSSVDEALKAAGAAS